MKCYEVYKFCSDCIHNSICAEVRDRDCFNADIKFIVDFDWKLEEYENEGRLVNSIEDLKKMYDKERAEFNKALETLCKVCDDYYCNVSCPFYKFCEHVFGDDSDGSLSEVIEYLFKHD